MYKIWLNVFFLSWYGQGLGFKFKGLGFISQTSKSVNITLKLHLAAYIIVIPELIYYFQIMKF